MTPGPVIDRSRSLGHESTRAPRVLDADTVGPGINKELQRQRFVLAAAEENCLKAYIPSLGALIAGLIAGFNTTKTSRRAKGKPSSVGSGDRPALNARQRARRPSGRRMTSSAFMPPLVPPHKRGGSGAIPSHIPREKT